MNIFKINKNEVHIWYQVVNLDLSPALEDSYLGLLPDDEQKKFSNFVTRSKKLEYLFTRLLVRKILSQYTGFPSASWTFDSNKFGRPIVSYPTLRTPLQFNISHSQSLITIAIGQECELGIDLESKEKVANLSDLARNNFSEYEFQIFKMAPSNQQIEKFYQYWTLKESYLKARGIGLSIPTKDFSFKLENGIQLDIARSLDQHPENWQFKLIQPVKNYQLALAYKGRDISSVKVTENWLNDYSQTEFVKLDESRKSI